MAGPGAEGPASAPQGREGPGVQVQCPDDAAQQPMALSMDITGVATAWLGSGWGHRFLSLEARSVPVGAASSAAVPDAAFGQG